MRNRLDYDRRLIEVRAMVGDLPEARCREVLATLATAALNVWTETGDGRWMRKIEHHIRSRT